MFTVTQSDKNQMLLSKTMRNKISVYDILA